ncbi:MAG: nicotinate-nucleotide adenylyltransferase [Coriobacteriales bacterium]|nr:nicotinate-nucleotide adenylyltransferase [Coriobacteriales bacterium]
MSSDLLISSRFDALIDAACTPFRLGLFGGTFDPVHIGHLHIAECAREQFALDGVLFIPTGQPVRKIATGFSGSEDRYAMLRAAVAGNACFDVSRIEIDRIGATYTIDTLRVIHERYGDKAQLFFITGADATADISTWKNAEEIAALTTILSAKRAIPRDAELTLLHNENSFDIRPIASCLLDVSSQGLRERVGQGHSIRYLVPDAVYAYIREQGLYQG